MRIFLLITPFVLAACSRSESRTAVPVASASARSSESASTASASPTPVPRASVIPSAAPDAEPPHLRAWFSVKANRKCPLGMPDVGQCYVVTLSLRGDVERDIVVAKNQWGQEYCRVRDGKSVECGGASGDSTISVRCAANGRCQVESVSQSDGYCPPSEDCSSRAKLTAFEIPTGAALTFAKD